MKSAKHSSTTSYCTIPQPGHKPLLKGCGNLLDSFAGQTCPLLQRGDEDNFKGFLNLLVTVAGLIHKMIDVHGLVWTAKIFPKVYRFMINCQDVHFYMQKTRLNL